MPLGTICKKVALHTVPKGTGNWYFVIGPFYRHIVPIGTWKLLNAIKTKIMFEKYFPNLDNWVNSRGWVELGSDEESSSWVRILDMGGMVWEDKGSTSLDEALNVADAWLAKEM